MAIDPVAISIFGFSIYWYGLVYAISFLFGYLFLMKFSSHISKDKELIERVYIITMISALFFGRIFHCIFYEFDYYSSNLLEIFAVWKGGMSSHGGIFGSFIALYYCSNKYKLSFLKLIDVFSILGLIGFTFGRLANFVNQEIVGRVTTSSFGIVFDKIDDLIRHPYQLYASAKNMLVLQILFYMYFIKKYKDGMIAVVFLILYNGFRFILDFIREVEYGLGIISMSQLLSLIFIIIGIVLYYNIRKN